MDEKTYQIADFIDKELPPEILEQLKIVGRVKQYLRPTEVSAISQPEDQPEVASDGSSPGLSTERELEKELDRLIDEVKDFENQVEQLEDLVDEHLKDMKIPPANDMISDAVNQLGGKDGIITKEIFDRAQAIIDYTPLMSLGIDPVLAAMVGDGTITGPRLKCAEVTPNIAKRLRLGPRTIQTAETSLDDMGQKINEQHDKKIKDFTIEFIMMLWWNQLWPKFVVDLTIINPSRQMVANPSDTLISFFKKMCNKGRFRRKPKACVQGTLEKSFTDAQGPLNKLLNRLRKFLLCKIPPKFYPDYKPSIDTKCPADDPPNCEQEKEGNEIPSKSMLDLEAMFTDIEDSVPCFGQSDLISNADTSKPEMFGCSPDCIKSAKIVLNAVEADVYKPPQAFVDTYNSYKQGNN